jgi:tetratricopeptide (TPR) repeat protein/serine/threonine protein kinase
MSDKPSIDSIFCSAIEIESPDQRRALVEEACGEDVDLKQQVERLLHAHFHGRSILDAPAANLPSAPPRGRGAGGEGGATIDEPLRETAGAMIGAYKLIETIGEGGMGTVWMAQQTQPVKRVVALKLIKAGMDSKAVIARFEAERQALALMDHANIARVLDAGTTSAGRPYFVMDLVKGVPITRYCDEHRLTPRQRLELFIPVCQAVQHAHQKGIIHRDIKPSNVLVALYDGKPVPKVIDFGLAKAAGQTLTDKTLVTAFGSLVGTLEYMSPEQAEVNQLDIDTRSDIYSLGVLIYELLTGSPPFTRKELKKAGMLEMLRVIREQEPSKPSTKLSTAEGLPTLAANRGTEPAKLTRLVRGELDWIVMKALEKDRNRRYETASGFARDVERSLNDEPVQACPPSAGYRLRKFVRRHKAGLTMAAVVTLAALLVVGSLGWLVRDRAARDEEAAREQADRQLVAEQALTRSAEYLREDRLQQAVAEARRAEAALASGPADEDLRQRVTQCLGELKTAAEIEEIRLGTFDAEGRDPEAIYAPLFLAHGIDVEKLPAEEAARRIRGLAIHRYLVAALDDWASRRMWPENEGKRPPQHLLAVVRAADPDQWRTRVRAARAQKDHATLLDLAKPAGGADLPPANATLLAWALAGLGKYPEAADLLRRVQLNHPDDFMVNDRLAMYLEGPPPKVRASPDAIRFYQAALAARPDSLGVHLNLAVTLYGAGRKAEARAVFRRLAQLHPKHYIAQYHLGLVLDAEGRYEQAIAAFKRAILDKSDFPSAHQGLGLAYAKQGKFGPALAELKEAVRLDPNDAVFQHDLAVTFQKAGQFAEAVTHYKKAVASKPNHARMRRHLGNALRQQGHLPEAIAELRKAIKLDPKSALAHHDLGSALLDQRKPAEAIPCFETAIKLDAQYAAAHGGLGVALLRVGKRTEASASFRKAIDLEPENAEHHYNLGGCLTSLRQLEEAIAHCEKAIALDPKAGMGYYNLGAALATQGKWTQAGPIFRKAIAVEPTLVLAHNGLGMALKRQGKLDEAAAWHKKAIALDPTDSDSHRCLGEVLLEQKRIDEAVACYRTALEHRPNDPAVLCNLGHALLTRGDLDEAIDRLRTSIKITPKIVVAHLNLAGALQRQKKLDEAVAVLRGAAELFPEDARVHSILGVALRAQGKLLEAIDSHRKAVALDPNNAQIRTNFRNALGQRFNEGVAEYRAGQWAAAVKTLDQVRQWSGGGDAAVFFFLAMTHHRLDRKKEARQWYDRAVECMEQRMPKSEELRRFRAEAEEVLGIKKENHG